MANKRVPELTVVGPHKWQFAPRFRRQRSVGVLITDGKRGIATPKEDMDIVHARLKLAEAFAKELRK